MTPAPRIAREFETRRPPVRSRAPEDAARTAPGGPLDALQAMADRSGRVAQLSALQTTADRGLPPALARGVEALSGVSMGGVEVHRNSAEPAKVGAHAFAQGSQIHLAPGQDRHLPHEAWHVAQQAQGRVRPTMQAKGVAINDDAGLEREADVMGARAVQMVTSSFPAAAKPSVATSGSDDTVQRVWEEADTPGIQRWDELIDGVRWYTDGTALWFEIGGDVRKGWRADYKALENQRKDYDAWVEISVEPPAGWFDGKMKARGGSETQAVFEQDQAVFREMYTKGKKYWGMYQENRRKVQTASLVDADTSAAFSERYDTRIETGQSAPANTGKNILNPQEVLAQHERYKVAATAKKGAEKEAYENYFDVEAGVVVGKYNYAREDPEVKGEATRRMANSEILANQFLRVGGDRLRSINEIVRGPVENAATLAVMRRIPSGAGKNATITVRPDQAAFFALLGTDNVKSSVFLLKDHAREFGDKTITHIDVLRQQFLKIHLG